MSARERVLARLRRAAQADSRLPPPPRPAVADDLVDTFCRQLAAAAASHEQLEDRTAIAARVAAYRAAAQLAGPTAVAPALADLAWPAELAVEIGSTDGRAPLAVSRAAAGIAETGSLLLLSGPDTPTRLNFLPEHQLVVLARSQVLRHLDDAWALLGPAPPRAVNLVTGPSRTADVEQTIQLGAHGPRRLHVLLVPG
jgi:L-lactate utilization protein LutC